MRELSERGKILPLGARILGDPGALEERGKGLALVVGDRDDAPRRELAMVGRAQRERDDGAQFGGVGPRRDHVARLARAAGGEVRAERGVVVEHGGGCVPFAGLSQGCGGAARWEEGWGG